MPNGRWPAICGSFATYEVSNWELFSIPFLLEAVLRMDISKSQFSTMSIASITIHCGLEHPLCVFPCPTEISCFDLCPCFHKNCYYVRKTPTWLHFHHHCFDQGLLCQFIPIVSTAFEMLDSISVLLSSTKTKNLHRVDVIPLLKLRFR